MPHAFSDNQKEVISVKEMATMLQLSRSRLHMLIKEGVFLPPVYDLQTRRPRYTRELIDANLDARRRNCGVNGRPICFYAPRAGAVVTSRPAARAASRASNVASRTSRNADLIAGLAELGIEATEAQVQSALAAAFPLDHGASADEGTRLREVYRCLRRSIAAQHSSRNDRT